MGTLHYGGTASFTIEDRFLTHLRSAVFAKLQLQESVVFTWIDGTSQRSIWIHPAIPLHFEFDGPETPELNHDWVERLISLANSSTGLRWVEEPTGSSARR